jgi:hypothetical protein
MRYRIGETYDPSRSNESRANQIEHALTVASDKNGEQTAADEIRSGVYTDVSDLLASVRHFCDRAGIDYRRWSMTTRIAPTRPTSRGRRRRQARHRTLPRGGLTHGRPLEPDAVRAR